MLRKSFISKTLVPTLFVGCWAVLASAQNSTFTYQGELKDSGGLANGAFNMTFALWDSSVGGNQIDSTITQSGVQVLDGKFNVELDFGVESFNNEGRWLEIAVNGFTLNPRTKITRSPYSLQTRGIFVDQTERVGVGTTNPAARLDIVSDTANSGNNTARFSAPSLGPNTSHIHYGLAGDWFIRSAYGFGDVIIQDTGGRVGIGTANPTNDARVTLAADSGDKALYALSVDDFEPTIHGLNIGAGNAFWAEGTSGFSAALLAENNGTGPAISAIGGSDAEPESGGIVVVGPDTGTNIVIDNNEIMARNNGSTSTLFLNADGGEIKMGPQQIQPAHAYAVINADGVILSASPNVLSVNNVFTGTFEITLDGGVLGTDIVLATGNSRDYQITTTAAYKQAGKIRVSNYSIDAGVARNIAFSFVVYRH